MGQPVAALADDLTGALEIGAQLAEAGLPCTVSLNGTWPLGATGAVLNMSTRHLASKSASAMVHQFATQVPADAYLYVKTDSTLRGRIRETFEALLNLFPERKLVFTPAYPDLGRTVKHGVLYVHGVPLAETSFAADVIDPVHESEIGALLGIADAVVLPRGSATLLREQTSRLIICDAESNQDLALLAAQLQNTPTSWIVAGAGALARHWASSFGRARGHQPPVLPQARSGLIVIGSRHPVSLEQLAWAEQSGIACYGLDTPAPTVTAQIALTHWAILRTPEAACAGPLEIAGQCGEYAARIVQEARVDALVAFGGDTAAAVLQALGCPIAQPWGQLCEGVPLSFINIHGRRLILVTKAGGFAAPDILRAIVTALEGQG